MKPRLVGQGGPWLLWVLVSVFGAILGALVAWRIRALLSAPAPHWVTQAVRDLATIVSATITAGAQWLLLRRYRLDVYCWVPASVTGSFLAVLFVIPRVLSLTLPPAGSIDQRASAFGGGAAVAAAELVIGTAQALVLRRSSGKIVWVWVPATVVGGGLAGAATSALSSQLFGVPPFASVSLLAGVGALLIAVSQAPVLYRILGKP